MHNNNKLKQDMFTQNNKLPMFVQKCVVSTTCNENIRDLKRMLQYGMSPRRNRKVSKTRRMLGC